MSHIHFPSHQRDKNRSPFWRIWKPVYNDRDFPSKNLQLGIKFQTLILSLSVLCITIPRPFTGIHIFYLPLYMSNTLIVCLIYVAGATWKWKRSSKFMFIKKESLLFSMTVRARVYTQWKEILSIQWVSIHTSGQKTLPKRMCFSFLSVSPGWFNLFTCASLVTLVLLEEQ